MKKTFTLVGLLGLSAAVGSASTITSIDTFNTTVQSMSNPSGGSCASPTNAPTAAATEAVGGQRSLAVSGNATGCAQSDTNSTELGAFSANLPGSNTGLFTVIWNNGSYDADFVIGFTFMAKQDADAPPAAASTVQFRVCTAADGLSGCTDSTTATVGASSFTSYSVALGSSISDINYIRMSVAGGPGRDVTVDFVNADIPEPGTFVMAAGALLGLGLLRRR